MSSLLSVGVSSVLSVLSTRSEFFSTRINYPELATDSSKQFAQIRTSSPEELQNLVSKMQSKVDEISPDLQFSVDKDTGKSVVKVTDRSTKEVVWQFPSEAALQISKELDRFQKGVLLSKIA